MHLFMDAIGFSDWNNITKETKSIKSIIQKAIDHDLVDEVMVDGIREAMIDFPISEHLGVSIKGTLSKTGKFKMDYYYPYLHGETQTFVEDFSLQRHAALESFAVMCDDVKPCVTLIFYLQNMLSYYRFAKQPEMGSDGRSLAISGLSLGGMILLPVEKKVLHKAKSGGENYRKQLINAAREGDEEAIQSLSMEDLDQYVEVNKRIVTEDIYSIVDSTLMPYGVECDQYAVVGEILDYHYETNEMSGEKICIMLLSCNDVLMDIAVNAERLMGEPEIGRRFKGAVWLSARVNF